MVKLATGRAAKRLREFSDLRAKWDALDAKWWRMRRWIEREGMTGTMPPGWLDLIRQRYRVTKDLHAIACRSGAGGAAEYVLALAYSQKARLEFDRQRPQWALVPIAFGPDAAAWHPHVVRALKGIALQIGEQAASEDATALVGVPTCDLPVSVEERKVLRCLQTSQGRDVHAQDIRVAMGLRRVGNDNHAQEQRRTCRKLQERGWAGKGAKRGWWRALPPGLLIDL